MLERTETCWIDRESGNAAHSHIELHARIPNGVTSIGHYAFSGCGSIKSITIPDSVTSIDWGAFSGCRNLTSVTIPNSVMSMGEGVFFHCCSLKSIRVPKHFDAETVKRWDLPDTCEIIWY